MVLNKCWFFYYFVLAFVMDKIQLKKHLEVIISLEKQFNIKFSYAVEDVANIAIEKPNTFTLQETIDYLNSKTLLNFKALDDRYVTVSVLNKTISVCGIVSDEKKSRLVASVFVNNNIGRSTITDGNGTFNCKISNTCNTDHFVCGI
jgi:hypothetical protein